MHLMKGRWLAAAVFAFLLTVMPAGGSAAVRAAQTPIGPGHSALLPAPRKVTPGSLPPPEPRGSAESGPFRPVDAQSFAQAKQAADQGTSGRKGGVVQPRAAAQAASSINGIAAFPLTSLPDQVAEFGQGQSLEPPDTQVAAGGTYLVEMDNATSSIWQKNGAKVNAFDLHSFFGVPSTEQFTDPRIVFDTESQRWFASGTSFVPGGTSSTVYITVTVSSDPTGTWDVFSFTPQGGGIADQPMIGVSSDKVVVSWNDYTAATSSGTYTGAEVLVVQKSDLPSASGQVHAFDTVAGSPYFRIVPAQSLSSTSTEWMAWDHTLGGPVGVIAVTGTPTAGNVTLTPTTLTGVTTSAPPQADQPSGTPVDTGDDRFLSAVWQNGLLWVSGTDGCLPQGDTTTRACLRVLQVMTPASGSPTVAQNFDDGVPGQHLYDPAVGLDSAGDAFLAYSHSSTGMNPGVDATAELAGSTTLQPEVQIWAGEGSYPGKRWGDYSAVATDPADPAHVWVAGEYALASNQGWGTAAGELVLTPTISSLSPASGAFTGGQTVTIAGTNFQSGATVTFGSNAATNVSVSSSTQLTATAPPGVGAVGVTVTNPDGTAATKPGAFTYDPAPHVQYFAWFDRISSPGFVADNIHVVNPGSTAANVVVDIPGQPGCMPHGSVPAGGEQYFTCPTGFGGPVTVNSDQPVQASQRVEYYQSFNEVSAQPASAAQTTVYFSWFDRVSSPGFMGDNIHVVNPGSTAANVHVSIPGSPGCTSTGTVPAGGEQFFTCPTGIGGPVKVTSDQPVLASQRVQYYQTFNEVLAQGQSAAASTLYMTWYDRVSSPGFQGDNVHLVNPGSSAAHVTISIPGDPACTITGTVDPGAEQHFTCATGIGGPVKVTSDQPVLASQRVQYYQSFNEVLAQPPSAAQKSQDFTWYDLVSSPGFLADNIHVVNPGSSPATVTVSIPGSPACTDTGTVAPGGEQYFTCQTGIGGPVQVASDQPVLASQRVEFYQSFNEVNALTP